MRGDTFAGHGSTTVRRVLETEVAAARARGAEQPKVVDVGGGSGVWAVPLAAAGCRVTVVEPNQNALATLSRRADEEAVADRITAVADDADALGEHVRPGSADLILAHGLLEVVDDPAAVVAALTAALAPAAAASVLTANRHAAVLQRALGGRLAQASELLTTADGVLAGEDVALLRRFDRQGLEDVLRAGGLDIALLQGDGVVADTVHGGGHGSPDAAATSWDAELAGFESVACGRSPLRDIASRLHVIARRPAAVGTHP